MDAASPSVILSLALFRGLTLGQEVLQDPDFVLRRTMPGPLHRRRDIRIVPSVGPRTTASCPRR